MEVRAAALYLPYMLRSVTYVYDDVTHVYDDVTYVYDDVTYVFAVHVAQRGL